MDWNLLTTGRRGFIQFSAAILGKWILFPAEKILAKTTPLMMQTGECILRPQQTEGPYFRDEMLNRSDIRTDPSDNSLAEGIPLRLAVRVSNTNGLECLPLPGAIVDIWHCNAFGIYSDVLDPNFDTRGKKYLRGYQVTDQNGAAYFTTIYPGWYASRAVHIHFKIRKDPLSENGQEFTSQLYFDDAVSNDVYKSAPYSSNTNNRITNGRDGIYQNGGSQLLLPVQRDAEGYSGVFDIALQWDIPTGANENKSHPKDFLLQQNYPNPFNATTEIEYSVPNSSRVTLKIFDSYGIQAKVLIDEWMSSGSHRTTFDASGLSSGVYYCQLKSGNNIAVKKLVLMK